MIIRLDLSIRNARLSLIKNALSAGATAGYLLLYTASQPIVGGGAITDQILLGKHFLSASVGAVADGVLIFDAIVDDEAADNSGEPTWARFYDGDGIFVMDTDVGDESSGAFVQYDSVAFLKGGLIQITAGSIIEGNL